MQQHLILTLGPVYDSVWTGPFNESRPIQQTSALDLLVAGSEVMSKLFLMQEF